MDLQKISAEDVELLKNYVDEFAFEDAGAGKSTIEFPPSNPIKTIFGIDPAQETLVVNHHCCHIKRNRILIVNR